MLTAGVDIGGTKLLAVAATEKGEIVAERRQPTADGPEAVLAAITAVVAELLADQPDIAAVGVGLPGLVDLAGVVHYAPNLPGFVGVAAQARLAAVCPVPVVVDNDANVAALAEVLHGAGRGHREVLMVTLGTGIGGGLVINGAVNRGGSGFAAEIGHFTVDRDGPLCACGGRGHWEALGSGTALGRRAREWAARIGASRGSPRWTRPPPITTSSGSRMLTRPPRPSATSPACSARSA
ncbi:MAG TPA: ROK family protein, partial [Acidimicrobiia bacterium]